MKQSGLLFQFFIVVIIAFTLIDASSNSSSSAAKDHRRKRRRCKCVHRFIDDVDNMIEEKLKRFEEKYFRPSLQNQVSGGETISEVDRRLAKLDGEVAGTKDSLQRLADNLETMKTQVLAQNQEVWQLADNFMQLDTLVRNLSLVVDILQNLVSENAQGSASKTHRPQEPTTSPDVYPMSCDEVFQQVGRKYLEDFYITIQPVDAPKPFRVLCNIRNNSGWTVIQRRQDGSVDFFRPWADYKAGFGSLEGEFWLGNDYIHWLTARGDKMLRIEMEDWGGRVLTATYGSFKVAGEDHNYKLHVSGYNTGDAGDSLTSHWENHDGMPFSTKDRDNDGRYYDNCAQHFHGAWWFNNCFDSHLNGRYYTKGFHQNFFQRDGIQWNSIHQYSSLKRVVMMVKPKPTRSRRHV